MTPRQAVSRMTADRADAFLERNRLALLSGFTLFYFIGTALRARSAPFWHDEVYTMLMSHLSLPQMWTAIRAGVDATPPLTDVLVKASDSFWGEGNIAARVPAMIGFWTFCLCLFAFVQRRLPISYAFAAMLVPLTTGAYLFSIQARCYGILFGFSSIALLAWQTAAEGSRRAIALPVLGLSIAATLFTHYYGCLVLLPLCGADFCRALRQKRVDVSVWCAILVGAAIGGALCVSLIAGVKRFTGHPFGEPHARMLITFYSNQLQNAVPAVILFLVAIAVWRSFASPQLDASTSSWDMPRDYEFAAGVLYVFIPVAGFAMAKVATHMFADRYFLVCITGVVLLAVFAVAALSRASRAAGICLLLGSLGPAVWVVAHHQPVVPVVDTEPLLRDALDQGAVVMDDGIHFLEQWYYLPPAFKGRLFYVADPESEARWAGLDTTDVGMLGLRRWFGVPALDYAEVKKPGNTFRILHNTSAPYWLPNRLLADGVAIETLQVQDDHMLLQATVLGR